MPGMMIDWTSFTPWPALAGGMLIGLAAAMLILLNGRVAGISGILGGLLRPAAGERSWQLAFVAGLLAAPLLWALFAAAPQPRVSGGPLLWLLGGLLVGLGTRYAAGCTSGHGVCGLARLSPRSLLATLTFMGAGFVTVYVLRHGVAA
jgi:uncharacterized membrane protein YedE/YeeE